jgi:hypothetical protein
MNDFFRPTPEALTQDGIEAVRRVLQDNWVASRGVFHSNGLFDVATRGQRIDRGYLTTLFASNLMAAKNRRYEPGSKHRIFSTPEKGWLQVGHTEEILKLPPTARSLKRPITTIDPANVRIVEKLSMATVGNKSSCIAPDSFRTPHDISGDELDELMVAVKQGEVPEKLIGCPVMELPGEYAGQDVLAVQFRPLGPDFKFDAVAIKGGQLVSRRLLYNPDYRVWQEYVEKKSRS